MARTPGPANQTYGYMNWFLNTGRKPLPSAPASAVTFQGNGSNIIYIDWDNDLVVVVRWIQQRAFNEFIGQVLAASLVVQAVNGPDWWLRIRIQSTCSFSAHIPTTSR